MENLLIAENANLQENASQLENAENANQEKGKKLIPENSEKSKKLIEKKDKKDKEENLSKINFNQFAKELQGINIIEKKERIDLYIYPDEWKGNKDRINSSEGKNFRNKRRDAMQRYCNEIFIAYKLKDEKGLNIAIKGWIDNYKSFYRINDYSLKSISQSNDAGKNKNIQFALDMIKELKGLNKKEDKKGK